MTDERNHPPVDEKATADNADLASLFRQASRMMARAYHRRDHAHHAQAHVLSVIRERGPINQRELLELLDVRSSSLSEVLSKLERNELIERRRNEEDRRSFVVSATDKATDAFPEQEGPGRESADHLFACLDQDERDSLAAMLAKIIETLRNDPLCKDADGPDGRGRGHGRGFDYRGKGGPGGKREGKGGRGMRGGRRGHRRRDG